MRKSTDQRNELKILVSKVASAYFLLYQNFSVLCQGSRNISLLLKKQDACTCKKIFLCDDLEDIVGLLLEERLSPKFDILLFLAVKKKNCCLQV